MVYYWSNNTPAAPSGSANVIFQTDGKIPEKRSAYTRPASITIPGIIRLDASADAALKFFAGNGLWKFVFVSKVNTLTDADVIAVNATLGNHFRVVVTGDHKIGNPTGAADGQLIRIEITQDNTGNRITTFDTKIKKPENLPIIVWSTAIPNATDAIQLLYNSAVDKFTITGYLRNIFET